MPHVLTLGTHCTRMIMSDNLIFNYNPEKNEKLLESRGIGFQEVISRIVKNEFVDIVDHPNQLKYPLQKIYIIEIGEYAYLIPFVAIGNNIFLKTIFPCRKSTKRYLNNRVKNEKEKTSFQA